MIDRQEGASRSVSGRWTNQDPLEHGGPGNVRGRWHCSRRTGAWSSGSGMKRAQRFRVRKCETFDFGRCGLGQRSTGFPAPDAARGASECLYSNESGTAERMAEVRTNAAQGLDISANV